MKNLLIALIPSLMCLTFSEKGLARNGDTKSRQNIPVIDKTKSYPKKAFDREVEETYILLETSKDVLLDRDAHVYSVSDKRMLVINRQQGDVFIFDMNGKAISHFNEKGRDGYVLLDYALYDEPNKEVFIVDNISKKIFVYSENGARKRTLIIPRSMHILEISNFDENALLAFHEHQYGPLKHKQPYFFISKKDGTIFSWLNITTNKVNPRVLNVSNGNSGTMYSITTNGSGNCKFGQEYILANMSIDTIYRLKPDKTLTPLFVQTPSVFSEPLLITSVRMITDDFVTFYIYPYDLKKVRKESESGKKPKGYSTESKHLMYEYKTGKFFELENNIYTADKCEVPAYTSVEVFYPYTLKTWLEKGRLKGKLKEIAKKVDENDNPVIQIAKFR
jgi:hypothetical protein